MLIRLLALTVAILMVGASVPASRSAAQAPQWRNISAETDSGPVPARAQHGLAVGPGDEVYVYGGAAPDGTFLDDLWRLAPDGTWRLAEPAGSVRPPPLLEPHIVVDAAGDVYEFGGLATDRRLTNGLYRWRAATGEWQDLSASAAAAGVPPRQDHGWEIDRGRGQIYAFGGDGFGSYLDDFWRYDIASGRWEDLTLASRSAAIQPRELYNLSGDGLGGLYLFGGTNSSGRLNDFWRYDLAAGVWGELTAATGSTGVPGRHYYGQACDAAGRFYVLGGWYTWTESDPRAYVADDFWRFDPETSEWFELTFPGQDGLLPRIPYVLGYQRSFNRLITFGGASGAGTLLNDTWVLELDPLPLEDRPTPTTVPPPPRILVPFADQLR